MLAINPITDGEQTTVHTNTTENHTDYAFRNIITGVVGYDFLAFLLSFGFNFFPTWATRIDEFDEVAHVVTVTGEP